MLPFATERTAECTPLLAFTTFIALSTERSNTFIADVDTLWSSNETLHLVLIFATEGATVDLCPLCVFHDGNLSLYPIGSSSIQLPGHPQGMPLPDNGSSRKAYVRAYGH